MSTTWKTIRVFISSTFRDMHAERDHLVRFVFPELHDRCARHRLHLVDLDLRWGLTEEEVEQGKALAICLDEIERCRPFFIGLLGERYGWVPPQYDAPDEPRYDWLRQFEPGHSITALEIQHGVLRHPRKSMHAFFYFRDPAFLSTMPKEHQQDYQTENDVAAEQLRRLKAAIRQDWPVFDYTCYYEGKGYPEKVVLGGLEVFGQKVLEDLWSAICQIYPETDRLPDPFAVDKAYHEAFVEGRSRRFVGRRDIFERMIAYADGNDDKPLVVTGNPGSGKSTLLAHFARSYAETHPNSVVLPHFIGASPGSTDLRRTLLRLCKECVDRCGLQQEIPEDYEQVRRVFQVILQQTSACGNSVVLLVDALDQMDTSNRAHSLDWLPAVLPDGVRLIVSTVPGQCLDALRRKQPLPKEIMVGPLTREDSLEIVRQLLGEYRKQLDERPDNQQMTTLLSKNQSDNPLFLVVACEELRLFGVFELLSKRINELPNDVEGLFAQVLERLEHDHGRELVQSALSLLACARDGLFEHELLELLRRDGQERLPAALWARLYHSLQFYLRPPGEIGDGRLGFFHQQLVQAVNQRYLSVQEVRISTHSDLAAYFRSHVDRQGDLDMG